MQVLVLVEGQTEEAFIKNCLGPYLYKFDIIITPIVVNTKVALSGLKTVGGLTNGNLYRFISELKKLLNSIPADGLVTTLIDYYAIPTNFPGYNTIDFQFSSGDKVQHLETSLHQHLGEHKSFIPYLQMHELEALLFSDPAGFESYIDPSEGNLPQLIGIIDQFENPELINNNKETSPSHRILTHYPGYNKPLVGNMMLLQIGIEQILSKCPRFRGWVRAIIARKG